MTSELPCHGCSASTKEPGCSFTGQHNAHVQGCGVADVRYSLTAGNTTCLCSPAHYACGGCLELAACSGPHRRYPRRSQPSRAHRGDIVGVAVEAEHRLRVVGVDLIQAYLRVARCRQQLLVCCYLKLVDLRVALPVLKRMSRSLRWSPMSTKFAGDMAA